MADYKTPEMPKKTPSELILSAVEALKIARGDQINGKLIALQNIITSTTQEQRKTLDKEIESADRAVKSNPDIQQRAEKLGVLTVISNIRIDLARLKAEMQARYKETKAIEEEGVSPWLVSLGNGIKTGAGATWTGAKFVGEKVKVNAVYAWKNFIVKPFSAIMGYFGVKNIQMPPVALHLRSMFLRFVGGFMPKATREAMQKNLDEEFAFHAISGQAKALVSDLNAERAKKTPPETPITLDFNNQLTQFRLLTPAERKDIPRKVMSVVKAGTTEITLETLFDGSKPEKRADTKKTAETEKLALDADGLPINPISFATLQGGGVEIGPYKNIKVSSSPAKITVGDQTWKMKGKFLSRAVLARFTITQAKWTGTTFDFAVTGSSFGKSESGKGSIRAKELLSFLEHLAKRSSDYYLKDSSGKETDAVLYLA